MSETIIFILISILGNQAVSDLSLSEAIEIALENNTSIKIERENVEISTGEIKTQQGIFDPILNINSSYSDSKIPTVSTFIPSGTINQEEFNISSGIEGELPTGTFYNILNFSLSRTNTDSPIEDLSPNLFTSLRFSLGQELLKDFGLETNLTPIITAKRNSDISRKELEVIISDTLLQVETNYWVLVATKKNLELERTALDLARDLQRRNEIQVEVGVLPPVAVTQAKAEVAARKVDVIRAENLLRASEDALKNLLAISLEKRISPTDEPKTEILLFDEDEQLREALLKRPEVEQAKLNIENKETLKKFFSNQRLPTLSVEGSVEIQGLGGDENPDRLSFGGEPEPIPDLFLGQGKSFRTLFDGDFPTWEIVGIFRFPLFNRTARGNYIKANAELDRSLIALKQVTDNVALDIRNAIREIDNSIRRIEAAKVSVELAEQVVVNEEERLNVGIGTTREVLEAQRDSVDAQTQEILAVTDYNIALAALEKARGTIISTNNIELVE